ncbi:Not1 N-terminal domain, CCR4-Not complex component-domain-containing protein [Daldinia loculata]|uniref:Not1 N-terminal domain, CCR4-Not complex component-domain-containing protein n=1 Tax=Daldinia loculata TaxID=103429 RepID=UPI0020C1C5B9|nr:Not1 N-terminal domain, CCR4-Not complex component-domain-containing protein [Daldinia loculata]KAI1650150.1 Not1 N-terminal domain, CCR4-Not complex component-domain-containing protein [Daldinia loculata]KAI2776571.1 Not1 N-terminal domain, CCR4-Not complex component-domain-containing protein [Daldinia loculata]
MAARKLQQEIDKCFKKVAEGVAEFDAIYEKIEQSNNTAQKEKLEDNLKREIKKLQRLRDQIKTWAASNDIKDKAPLLEHRKLIETQMERFKAVEKAMKTKAYSKEGLSAAAKLDPKEQAKVEAGEFLSSMVDELEQQIEALEAEGEAIQATMKKGKSHAAKADRMAAIEHIIERHKWHQGKLELIRRSLDNGGVDTEQVNDLEESIRYYVTDGTTDDYIEDEGLYDELNLQEEEDVYGMVQDNDRVSSQDTQSIQEDVADVESRSGSLPGKSRSAVDAAAAVGRRPSAQMKSPLPTLATLHNPLANVTNGSTANAGMKPASLPTRPAGEGLKYASAAAAAAASDKNNVGIAPLPPPPGSQPISATPGISPLPPAAPSRTSAANSPSIAFLQPAPSEQKLGSLSVPASVPEPKVSEPTIPAAAPKKPEKASSKAAGKAPVTTDHAESSRATQSNGIANGIKPIEEKEEESIYHLPASLQDLVESFEVTKKRSLPVNSPSHLRMMAASQANLNSIDAFDSEPTRIYRPDTRYPSASGYPQEPLPIFEDPRLYSRIEPDTLFYVFYYKQGTYQQYLAAKALKDQSWRFHKQYQTWFQRHEEPKSITEEFEQGTYRFFDYESTWMNRRKADFKFAYRFLEDDV